MDKTTPPRSNHSNHKLPDDLWRSTLEIQANLLGECTKSVLTQLARNRLLVSNQLKQMSAQTERLISAMAHISCRSVAIATNARRKDCERRVFPLPLPSDRRFETQMDRRQYRSNYAPPSRPEQLPGKNE